MFWVAAQDCLNMLNNITPFCWRSTLKQKEWGSFLTRCWARLKKNIKLVFAFKAYKEIIWFKLFFRVENLSLVIHNKLIAYIFCFWWHRLQSSVKGFVRRVLYPVSTLLEREDLSKEFNFLYKTFSIGAMYFIKSLSISPFLATTRLSSNKETSAKIVLSPTI